MRRIAEYTLIDWFRLIPLKWFIKELRNTVLLKLYLNKPSQGLDQLHKSIESLVTNKKIIIAVIAFERPQLTKLQLEAFEKFFPGALVIVCDNSRDVFLSVEISDACKSYNALYVKLPFNNIRHANRNHSLAMQYVYEHILSVHSNVNFGFVDHDLIPIQEISHEQIKPIFGCYGLRWDSTLRNGAWQLWPGYCFFDSSVTKKIKLDFMYDFANGLDTGGKNYSSLYTKLEAKSEMFCDQKLLSLKTSVGNYTIQLIDEKWAHLGGSITVSGFKRRNEAFEEILKIIESDSLDTFIVSEKILERGFPYTGYDSTGGWV